MALERLLARTRARLEERRARRPLADLFEGLAPSGRSFERALRQAPPAFILEVKPRSPSRGALRATDQLVPVLDAYARHASAISVLTEPEFFGGSYDLLRQVRGAVRQPVLAKDFILDPYQVVEARYHGADAVLLMLSVLDDAAYASCAAVARELQMGVLTEVHTATEMRRARTHGAQVIGINNRDLGTLKVDVATTLTLAPLVPPGALCIAESGIDTRATFERLLPLVDGALVGSSLMQAQDVDRAVRHLVFGTTKICGLTRPDDARAAHGAGATHGGLVFHAPSPRAVSLSQADTVRRAAPLDWVGVFVDAHPATVAKVAGTLSLAGVQLHGCERADDIAELRECLDPSCEIWQAVTVRDRLPDAATPGVDLTMFDGYAEGRRGGTGRTFNWSLLEGGGVPYPYGLAGGLSPQNVAHAAQYGARILDVSSGVESSPGCKEAGLVNAFLRARRSTIRHASLNESSDMERVA